MGPIAPSILTTLARGRLTLRLSPRLMLMPTPLPRSTMDFPLPMLSPLDMLPTLLTLPLSIPTGDTSEDTTDTVDCLDTVAWTPTTLARGRLTLMLMPTP